MSTITVERHAAMKQFWATMLSVQPNPVWQAEVRRIMVDAELRRPSADYDTGSITEGEAYALRALAEHLGARVVLEVGTFIGTSTCALASASSVQSVYTCDASNDCLPMRGVIEPFPRDTSTQMLQQLAARMVRADLCFFDGVLSDADVKWLKQVTTPSVVFALHDHNYGPKRRKAGFVTVPRKGIGNAQLLQRAWRTHVLVEPPVDTTLALLIPESLL